MSAVWIAQCLCPARHCILASAGVAEDDAGAEFFVTGPLRQAVDDALRSGVLNPWCGLCQAGADSWRYEAGRTRFRTMDEAMPTLWEEAKQALAAHVFSDIPRSD
jgi:hypothetical protein